MIIQPLRDNVLLKIKEKEQSLIVVPKDAYDDETALIAEVIELGSDVKDFKKKDLVLFKKHLFDEVVLKDNLIYLLGREENITAKILSND